MEKSKFISTAISLDALNEIATSQRSRTITSTGVCQGGCVWLLAFGHFINDTYTGYLSPLLPLLMEQMRFPLSRAGILASVLSVSTSLLQPIFGVLNDRFGKRFFVFSGPLITGIFICSLGYIPSYWMLIPLLIISGIGSSIFHPSAAAMVSKVSGYRKEWGMSLFITAGNFGYSISPLIVVPVVTAFGLKALPLMVFPALFVALLLFQRLPEPDAPPVHSRNFLLHGEAKRLRLPLFLHLLISFLRSLVISGFGTFIPLYMRSHGHSFFSSGATTTIFLSIGSVGALISGHFATRIDRRQIIMFSLLAAAPLLVIFLYLTGWLSLLALALSGILLYFSFPLNVVMAQELFPQRASTISALMIGVTWGTAGLMMTPLGFIAERVGLESALLVLAFVGFLAAFAASFLPKDDAFLRKG